MIDNKTIYTELEFDRWAQREQLEPGETFIIEKYLDPHAKTLEAGSGGGRLLLAMQARGFDDLHGFDFVPELVAAAKKRDRAGTIDFRVGDATRLDYGDESFDQLVYLQQVLCLIPSEAERLRAVREAVRILRPGGLMVISLLSNRQRRQTPLLRALLGYLYVFRKLTFRDRSMQSLPWLKLGGKVNWGALLDRGPFNYWFNDQEAEDLFRNAGLKIMAVGSDADVAQGELRASAADLRHRPFSGSLYLVCRKPG